MPVIDGQIALDLKKLYELIDQLKEAQKQGKDTADSIQEIQTVLTKVTSQGVELSKELKVSLKEVGVAYKDLSKDAPKDLEKVTQAMEKAESAYSKFRQTMVDARNKGAAISLPNLEGSQYEDARARLLRTPEGTGLFNRVEQARRAKTIDEEAKALRRLNASLSVYAHNFSTVSEDEIGQIEEIIRLHVVRSNQDNEAARQIDRTAKRIIERSKNEIELKKQLKQLDLELTEGLISREDYETKVHEIALQNRYLNVEGIEQSFKGIMNMLEGSAALGDKAKEVSKNLVDSLGATLSDAAKGGYKVDEASMKSLIDMLETLGRFEGEKGNIVKDLIEPLQELTNINIESLLPQKLLDLVGLIGDPTSANGARQYASAISEISNELAKGEGEGVAEYNEILKLLGTIEGKYKEIGLTGGFKEYTNDDIKALKHLENTVREYGYINKEVSDGAADSIRLVIGLRKEEENRLERLDALKREEETLALKQGDFQKKFHVDAEEHARKLQQYKESELQNVTLLRDMFDKLLTRYRMFDEIGGSAVKANNIGTRELIDTMRELSKESNMNVVHPDQIKYLERIRKFLIDNGTEIVSQEQSVGVSRQIWKETVEDITNLIARSQEYNDVLKHNKTEIREIQHEAAKGSKDGEGGGIFDKLFGKLKHAVKMVVLYRLVRDAIQKVRQAMQYMIKTAIEYEQAMANVAAVASAYRDEVRNLDKAVINAANTTRYTAVQVADALYFMAQAGFKSNEAIKALNGTLVLAQATNKGVEQTAELMAASFRQFNLETDQADRIANVYAASINKSMSSLDKLSIALKQAGPVAGAMNISIEETVGLLDLMFDRGIQGSRAGRALRNAFADMSNPASALAKKMSGLGLDFDKVNLTTNSLTESFGYLQDANLSAGKILELFGKVIGTQLVVALRASREELGQYIDEVSNTNHAYEAMEVQMDTLRGDMDKLKASFSATAGMLGQKLNPLGRSFIGVLRAISNGIGWLVGGWVDTETAVDRVNDSITDLTKSYDMYAGVVKKLESDTLKLTEAEKTQLRLQKELYELSVLRKAEQIAKDYESTERSAKGVEQLNTRYAQLLSFMEDYRTAVDIVRKGGTVDKQFLSTLINTKDTYGDMSQVIIDMLNKDKNLKQFRTEFTDIDNVIGSIARHLSHTSFESLIGNEEAYSNIIGMLDKVTSSIVSSQREIKNYVRETDNVITDLAMLLNKGVIDESAMLGWSTGLRDLVLQTAKDLREAIKEDEGVFVSFDTEMEELTAFTDEVESFLSGLKDELKKSAYSTSIEEGFRLEREAIEKTRKEYMDAIEERYDANMAAITVTQDLNEEGEEAILLANKLSRAIAEEKAERQRAREEAALSYMIESKLAEIAYEKKKAGIELEKAEQDLLTDRANKLLDINKIEPEYEKKVLELNKQIAEHDMYESRLAVIRASQKEELRILKKAEKDKLDEIDRAYQAEVVGLERKKDEVLLVLKEEYAERSRLLKVQHQDKITQLGIDHKSEVLTTKEYAEEMSKLSKEFGETEVDNRVRHNELLLSVEEEYNKEAEDLQLFANDQIEANELYHLKELEDMKRYHLLQIKQLDLEYRRKEIESAKDYDGSKWNYFKSDLKKEYEFEKKRRKDLYDLDLEDAGTRHQARLAAGEDETESIVTLHKEVTRINRDFRKEDLDAEKEYLREKYDMYVGYAEGMLSLMSNVFDMINTIRASDLQAELDAIDARMNREIEAADEDYIRSLDKQDLLSELGSIRLQQLDDEVEAARAAGDEEALIAAETALKKFISDDWQHYEKLQNLEDALTQARRSGSEEAVAKARADLEKYESEKEYLDKKKEIEEEAAIEKAKLEYDSALKEWQLQSIQIIADAAMAQVKSWMAPFPMNLISSAAALAGTGAAMAAHSAARPIPQFESGGIVLGSPSGSLIRAGEKNRTELISNPEQMANLLLAIGNQGVASEPRQITLIFQDNSREQARYTVDLLNNSVLLLDPKRALKKV